MLKKFVSLVFCMAPFFLMAAEPVSTVLKMDFETMPAGVKGPARLVPGKASRGKAISFNGDSYVQFAPDEKLIAAENGKTITIECWFYREEEDEHGFIIRHNGSFALRIVPWDPRRINVGIPIPGGFISMDSEACLKSGVWQHIAVIITPENVELLIDGHRQFKRPLKHPIKSAKHPVVIGAGLENNGKIIANLSGCIDNLEISAGAKSKAYFDAIAADTSENFEAIHNTVGMPPKCAPGKEITSRIAPEISRSGSDITVNNSFYTLVLQTAGELRIKKLFNKFTGSDCFNAKGSPLFTVNLNGSVRRADPADFTVKSCRQSVSGKSVKLDIICAHKSGVEMLLTLTFDDSQDISIDSTMRNGSKKMRLMPSVPLLENISVGKDFSENWYFNPQVSGWAGKKSYEVALAYGFRSWMQFADVFSPALGGGINISGQDTKGTAKGIITRKTKKNGKVGVFYNLCWVTQGEKEPVRLFDEKSSGLGMGFIYMSDNFAPGEEFKMPPAKISVHRGSVITPLMDYSKWCKKAFPHEPLPEHTLKEFNYAAVHRSLGNAGWFKGFEVPGKGICLADNIAPDGSDHQLQLAFWWQRYESGKVPNKIGGGYMYKNSSGESDYNYDSTLGGLEKMREEIRKCAEKGTNVVLYTCSRVAGDDSKVALEHPEWALYTVPGKQNRSWGCFNVCTQVPGWQDMYAAANARIVRDLPVSGIYLDTTAEILRCFNPAHPHPRNPVDGIASLLSRVRKAVKGVRKDVVIMTEYIGSEYFATFIDSCWVQTFANPHAHAFNNFDLDFMRFVYPKIKYAEWGQTPRTFDVDSRRMFFNGVGGTRGDLNNDQKIRFADMTNTMREMFDAMASEDPLPYVPTETEWVFANFFPGKKQTAWTYYNKAGALKNAPLIKVAPEFQGKRFVELLSDREITPADGVLKLDMAELEVGMIAAFDRILEIRDNGHKITVSVDKSLPAGCRMTVISGSRRDSIDNSIEMPAGKSAEFSKTVLGKGKAVFKLFDGDMLIDETVITL